jgi:hypothetical protein
MVLAAAPSLVVLAVLMIPLGLPLSPWLGSLSAAIQRGVDPDVGVGVVGGVGVTHGGAAGQRPGRGGDGHTAGQGCGPMAPAMVVPIRMRPGHDARIVMCATIVPVRRMNSAISRGR